MSDEFYEVTADKFIFKVKKGLLYTENDVWVQFENGQARFGITDLFQRRGGDILYVQLPHEGDRIERFEEVIQLETIKAVVAVKSPLAGTVSKVNSLLNDKPELINEDPYGECWLALVSPSNLEEEKGQLLTAEKYFELLKTKISDELGKRTEGKSS